MNLQFFLLSFTLTTFSIFLVSSPLPTAVDLYLKFHFSNFLIISDDLRGSLKYLVILQSSITARIE